ncbi:hypothetical protein C8J56DRAFT_1027225 [Mycena floridula]|nr:hypothetical protein C8J56DRAFT_1027225 [Mycena floridula]
MADDLEASPMSQSKSLVCEVCGSPSDAPLVVEKPVHSPAILDILNSNRPPTNNETAQIRGLCGDSLDAISRLDVEISQVRAQLTDLLQKRADKERELADYKIILHPLRRTPVDILCEIFLSTIDDIYEEGSVYQPTNSFDRWILPWPLGLVSRRWRSVALSCHKLWSTVIVWPAAFNSASQRSHDPDDRSPDTLLQLSVQLMRSGSHPLSVSLCADWPNGQDDPMIPLLISSSTRWEVLELYMPFEPLYLLSPIREFLPALKRLCFHRYASLHYPSLRDSYAYRSYDFSVPEEPVFQICPTLTTIESEFELAKLPTNMIRWEQITSYIQTEDFYSDSPPNEEFVTISRMSNLQSLTWRCRGDETRPLAGQYTFTHLRELALLAYSSESSVLDHLTLPALKSLRIEQRSVDIDILPSFTERSRCRIENLEIAMYDLSDLECLPILTAIPSLKSLMLRCEHVYTDGFMDHLFNPPTFLPSLELLAMEGCNLLYDMSVLLKLRDLRPRLAIRSDSISMRSKNDVGNVYVVGSEV